MNIIKHNNKRVNLNGWRNQILHLFFFSLITFSSLLWSHNLVAGELSVDDISNLLENNLKVKLSRMDLKLAVIEQEASLGELDVEVALSYFENYDHSLTNSSLDRESIIEKTTGQSLGVSKKNSYGMEFELSVQSLKKASNSINTSFEKWHQLATLAKLKIPLLSGRAREVNLEQNLKSYFKIERYRAKLIETFSNELHSCYSLYWDIYLLNKELELRKANITNYNNLSIYFEKAYRLGDKGRIRNLEVSSLFEKETALYYLKQNKKNNLLLKLNKKIGSNFKDIQKFDKIIPSYFTKKIGRVGNFKSINSKLQQIEMQIKESDVSVKKAKNQLLPELDINLEYLTPGISESNSSAWEQISTNEFPNYTIGLTFSWSFGNNTKQGSYAYQSAVKNGLKRKLKNEKSKHLNKLQLNENEVFELKKITKLSEQQQGIWSQKLHIQNRMYRIGRISVIDYEKLIIDSTRDRLKWIKQQLDLYRKQSENLILTNGYESLVMVNSKNT